MTDRRRVALVLIAAGLAATPSTFAQSSRSSASSGHAASQDDDDEDDTPARPPAQRGATAAHPGGSSGAPPSASSSAPPPPSAGQAPYDYGTDRNEVDAQARRERMLPRFNALDGSVGLLHLASVEAGGDRTFRFSFTGEYYQGSFLRHQGDPYYPLDTQLDNTQHIGATLGLSFSPWRFFDLHMALRSYANSMDTSTPGLFQVLGDTIMGMKVFAPVFRGLNIGADISLYLLSPAGDIGTMGASTSANFRLMATLDLQQLAPSIPYPIRIHFNGGYFLDNSANLVSNVESLRQQAYPGYYMSNGSTVCTDPMSSDPHAARNNNLACQQLITREERFALGISRADKVNLGLGIDFVFPYVRPFIEWNIGIPVVRNGFVCYIPSTGPGDDDHCLAGNPNVAGDTGFGHQFAAMASDLTIGTRVAPPQIRGLAALLAIDIATGGDYVFVRELTPNMPWVLYFGLAYAHDFAPDIRRVDVPREVVREVRVDNTPIHGRLAGTITDSETHQPIAGAVIDLNGHEELGYVATSPHGTYHTHNLPPAEYELHVRAIDYNENTCRGTVPPPTGTAREVPDVTLDCALRPIPRVGNIIGRVTNSQNNAAVPSVAVTLTPTQVTPPAGGQPPQPQTMNTGADGSYTIEGLMVGTYTVSAAQTTGTRASLPRTVEVQARANANGDIQVGPVDARGITVTRGAIQVREQIHFQTDSAEILPDSSTLLERIADMINRHPEIADIEIQGHTDNTSTPAHNVQLSQSRAESVRTALVNLGVNPSRLTARGYGQSRPIAPNLTAAGRQRNRRVMFVISHPAPAGHPGTVRPGGARPGAAHPGAH